MKKTAGIITLLMVLAIGISGCGSSTQAANSQSDGASSAATEQGQPAKAGDTSGNAGASAASGKGQFTKADLSGEVASVNGNEITLKLIEMPNIGPRNGQRKGDQGGKAPADNSQGNSNQESKAPAGNPQEGNGQGGSNGAPQQRTLKYTGESKTVTIPDGTAITTFNRGANGAQAKTVQVKDIKQGDILQVWYSDKDKGTISRISVMTPRNK